MLNKSNRFGRNPVVLLGLITHFVAFFLIFLNIASDAPIASEAGTDLQAYITPRYENHPVSVKKREPHLQVEKTNSDFVILLQDQRVRLNPCLIQSFSSLLPCCTICTCSH